MKFNKLKYHLRHLRANGRFTFAIDILIKVYHLLKSTKQRLKKRAAMMSLEPENYGSTPKEWVHFIWNTCDGFFRPIQQKKELQTLIEKVHRIQPQSVLEVGTAGGGTLFLFCQASSPKATVVSIDLPRGINGGGYPNWKTFLYEKFARPSQTLHLLRCDSHIEQTKNKVSTLVPTGKFDLIMIDADHSYEGVSRDFELYSPLVAKGGIMVFHDVIKNRFDPSIQVDRLWDELTQKYKTEEIVFDYKQGNMGLGIVYT